MNALRLHAEPAVSVVVPVYNPGPYLAPLLASLREQSEPSLQIVVVNDGSTDGSLAILQEAAARDPRLTVVSQPNRGFSATRNAGMDHARGRWVAFADADDWLDPRTLQTWRERGERDDLEVVFGNGFRFAHDQVASAADRSDRVVHHPPPAGTFTGADWIEQSVARSQWLHFVWLQLIRRDVLLREGFRFDESIVHEDVLWSMQLGLRCRRIGFVADPMYGYRNHPASFVHNRTPQMLLERARSYLVIMHRLMSAADERCAERGLYRALIRHAHREGRNFLALMKRGVLAAPLQHDLAAEFIRLGLDRVMLEGAEDARSLWRAVRSRVRLRWLAAR